jgi:putative transposase
MGRDHRPQIAGGIYHVFARGNRRDLIYRVDYDYDLFLLSLGGEIERRGWNCLAYALLPNHYHLLFETPEANLSVGMQRLNLRWAKAFNREYGMVGHVFQGRFGSRLIGDGRDLESALRYVSRNPVNAGLCRDPADWSASSYAELVGTAPPRWLVNLERLAELLGCSVPELPDRMKRLVA